MFAEALSGGTGIELAGNRPLFAVDENAFWVVSKGNVMSLW